MEAPLFSKSLNREIRPEAPCPICGENRRQTQPAGTDLDGNPELLLRCINGHAITMVRMPVIEE